MHYVVAAVAAISGFLFGFDEGIIAGAHGALAREFAITPLVNGIMTAAVPLGAVFGAAASGRVTQTFGRRRVLYAAAIAFFIGSLLAAGAVSVWMLVAARLLLGVAVGVASMAAPLYIAETAPQKLRGRFVSAFQLAITVGILVSYMVGLAFSQDDNWRLMFAAGAIPAVILFLGLVPLPESPRWFALRGRWDDARTSLAKVTGDHANVDAAVAEMRSAIESETEGGTIRDLFRPMMRPALIVAMGLFFLQQLSGINAVIYYAPQIFREVGFADHAGQLLATIGIGGVNVAMTIVGMLLIDRIGRRRLLLIGFGGTAVSLAALAVTIAPGGGDEWISLIGLAVFIAAFAVSLGPLPYVLMSEIFPLDVRGAGMALASITNWGFNFLVVLTFPTLAATIGVIGVFGIFAFMCFVGFVFGNLYVPETRGISLEQIERHIRSGAPLMQMRAA